MRVVVGPAEEAVAEKVVGFQQAKERRGEEAGLLYENHGRG